jgi:uncharacterized protein YcbK (DUF882 family)
MISKHFSRSEFACQCGCGFDTVDHELINVLEDVRELYGPVNINSGSRCVKHNKAVGGSDKSQHLYGKAADIVTTESAIIVVANYLEKTYPDKYGIGRYTNPSRIHIDVRPDKARWSK